MASTPNLMEIKKLRICIYPDPLLRRIAKPVDQFNRDLAALVGRMTDLMLESDGIGLAGPQVGLSLRMVVVSPTGKRQDTQVLVNPELSNFQGTAETEEGCLSLPAIRAQVQRPASCTLTAQDIEGNKYSLEADGLLATVIQHEIDHLDGVLFIDRLSTVGRMACRRALKQLEREYENKAL